jgi:tubulin polyglutamylase TTLL4
MRLLKREWEEGGVKNKWIIKPPASARGIGIRVVHKWSQLPKKRPVVVQRYISNPYLIRGSKFDLRVYVYVTSYDPLRIYMFRDGLARFATCKYTATTKSLSNRFVHLTNYSINKKNVTFEQNPDETVCQGHKWGLLALWEYMRNELGVDTDKVWESIKDLAIKTIISSEAAVVSYLKANVRNKWSCHELFGFDVMLDSHLKPWIIEVNISPSLHSNSQLDINIKGRMMRDILNMCQFTVPTGDTFSELTQSASLTSHDRAKHALFVQKSTVANSSLYSYDVLDNLTEDDVRVLMETEDELKCCGHFERVFPSPTSYTYLKYFEIQRYYNVLLNAWVGRYSGKQRLKGIALLSSRAIT